MIDIFRHNSWATLRLLDFCRDLDPGLLDATAPGAYGSVKETLAYLVGGEEVLAGIIEGVSSHGPPARYTSMDDLQERARWLAERWERSFEQEPHSERLVERDRGDGERRLVRIGTVVAQAIHHGNHYRAQVCMILSTVGMVAPALDGWSYGMWLSERGDHLRRRDAV
jgi:uncharacterized damage-inducible protein DinB